MSEKFHRHIKFTRTTVNDRACKIHMNMLLWQWSEAAVVGTWSWSAGAGWGVCMMTVEMTRIRNHSGAICSLCLRVCHWRLLHQLQNYRQQQESPCVRSGKHADCCFSSGYPLTEAYSYTVSFELSITMVVCTTAYHNIKEFPSLWNCQCHYITTSTCFKELLSLWMRTVSFYPHYPITFTIIGHISESRDLGQPWVPVCRFHNFSKL